MQHLHLFTTSFCVPEAQLRRVHWAMARVTRHTTASGDNPVPEAFDRGWSDLHSKTASEGAYVYLAFAMLVLHMFVLLHY
jgi:hypothetical protein